MTITQIKEKIQQPVLEFRTALDQNTNQPTEWLRHWDNDNRVSVSIHKDTAAEIKANPKIMSLGVQTETRTAELGDYTSHRIVAYTPADLVL